MAGAPILADTSVWISFFRDAEGRAAALARHLEEDRIVLHPWVLGELALGNLGRDRRAILEDLARLPAVEVVRDEEILQLIEARRLPGSGLGWVDAQLLGAALVTRVGLWTHDRNLRRAALAAGCAAVED